MALEPPVTVTPPDRQQGVAALALLSLAAGFLHAAVIDSHRGHGIAAGVFAATALFQILWAGLVMARASRGLLAAGAIVNAAIVVGYVMSRTVGIDFIDGFQEVEPVAFTDAVATGLELVLAVGAGILAYAPSSRRLWPAGRLGTAGLAGVGLAVALISVPAAAGAGSLHEHGEGEEAAAHSHGGELAVAHTDGHDHAATSTIATPEEQAAADQLLADTVEGLWQWTDPQKVHDAGFRPINDDATGTAHLVNWDWINDDVVLDPAHPESLVYRVTPQGRVLEAAMFMAPAGTPDDQVPDVGGPITQWHIHDNLCYSPVEMVDGAPERHVIGIVTTDGNCTRGEHPTPEAPMLHVWVVPQRCGPFSALEGVGAGQAIEEVQDPATAPECQHSH
jgi:hypothetical protein